MLDITTARAAGDRGAQLALDFAVRGGFDFEGACKFVRGWLVRHGPTPGEVLVSEAQAHGYRGKDGRCFGGVFVRLQKLGQIKCIRADLPRVKGHSCSGGRLWAAM
jgi:hypothetical protein